MAEFEFSRFSFQLKEKEDVVLVTYAKRYQAKLSFQDFKAIDEAVLIEKQKIIFPNEKERRAEHKLDLLLEKALHSMKHLLNGKDVIFVDESLGLPLVGAIDFGLVDRGTNIIEVKPLTGCNLNCVYCSVDEGVNNKIADILVDDAYLISEARELASIKKHPVEFNIGPHGEPFLYPFMIDLVKGLRSIPQCEVISVNTNGTLLTKELLDELKEAGLTRLNISLNTLDEELATRLAQKPYDTKHLLEMIRYANSIGLFVQIAPLIVPTYNDDPKKDIAPLVALSKELQSPYPTIGIQKYLCNKGGRNPVDEVPFENFFSDLHPLEKEFDVVLTPRNDPYFNPYNIFEDVPLEKPLRKNQVLKVKIVSPGRTPSEKFCVAEGRTIRVKGLLQESGFVKIKLVRDKHNIYLGVPV